MRVKRYVADSIQEAIVRVKNDLGRNAIILHTKPFKEGGFLGLFRKRRFEVIAAVDEEPKPVYVHKTPSTPPRPERMNPELHSAATSIARNEAGTPVKNLPDLNAIQAELAEVKALLRQNTFKPLQSVVPAHPAAVSPPRQRWEGLRKRLAKLSLTEELIDFIITKLPAELELRQDIGEWVDHCQRILEANLLIAEPFKETDGQPEVVALVGPTGVGKTTTIAKLAANLNLFDHKKVGLITIDTYRIAAVEHLRTYGDIMNIPVEVVYLPSDLERAIENLRECDVILIDTAGRSPHNPGMMDELQQFLTHSRVNLILLVLSATTQLSDMVEIEAKFSKIAYTHLVITKLDETRCLGPIVSLAWKVQRPLSYLTTGQNVPDDIELAKADKLVTQLLKGMSHG